VGSFLLNKHKHNRAGSQALSSGKVPAGAYASFLEKSRRAGKA
jgi:hypothetical protein